MKLLVPILLNCIFVTLFYLLDKKTDFKKLNITSKQILIGVVFGGLSAFASGYGVEILGTVANVRDAAPLCAGLIFGAPAGIISGVLGGLYRFFSVFWGGGEYTQIACTLSTMLAGLIAAVLRRFMFDNKKPTWSYGVFITVVCEVIHMLMIFFTNMDDSSYAFEFVKGATVPMIIGNSAAVGISLLLVSLLNHEERKSGKKNERISQTFQRKLLVLIIIACVVTSTFTYVLQNGMAEIETREVFTSAMTDVITDVRGKSNENLLSITKNVRSEYEKNKYISLDSLAEKYNVIEINVVASDGTIIASSEEKHVDSFNMNSTEQSKEFMVLTGEKSEYVQVYSPRGSDGVTMRKYAGVSLKDGGFIQVGYDADQFHDILDDFVIDVTKNRHVGSTGFVAVCDENLNLVTHTERSGKHISTIGIVPDEVMLQGKTANKLYKTNVINAETNFSEEYIYVFSFVEGYCIIAAMPAAEAMLLRDASLYTSIFTLILIFAALFVFIYFLIKKVIINNLQKINGTLSEITGGNLNVKVDVRSNAEFSSLSDDINSTVATLKRYIGEAAARIDKELEYAKQIQLSALPSKFPDTEGYAIYAQMIAAKEVGGDFYDFYTLDGNTVLFLAADVSGKGIPAAMFMMTAKTIIRDLAERGLSVDEIFTLANEKLCENNESGMFVTAWMGKIDLSTGVLSFANAGHNPPVIVHADGECEYLKSRTGFVLAGMEGMKYRANEITLNKGDRIFIYTDGVTEATDKNEALYGEDRLMSYIDKNKGMKAEELLSGLKEDIDLFAGDTPQFDDITMLVFDYKKKEGAAMKEKVFSARKDALPEVMSFTEECLDSFDCPMKSSMAICVAVEEVFINIASYAYGEGTGEAVLSFGFDEAERLMTFVVKDEGVPFNPLQKAEPDITLSAADREIGGLGIFITKKTMDTVSYRYENGKNILTMTKKI
ncbi:MAG: SpoIIE family protein phosphatase [Acutalibacteraceae bacterium]|nr:SpoIIE family protein phosphatase [Acutalibacteraceae bacterium]